VLAPTQGQEHGADINALDNRIVSQSVDAVTWRCTTFKNPSTLHPATAAVILELDGDASTRLTLTANGRQLTASLPELLTGSRGMHMQEWSSECALLHRAVPESCFTLDRDWTDEPESEHDVYDVEVRQANLQMAWVSPIFCTSR